MKQLLIFGGTTEGRHLSALLSRSGVYHTVCVATEYGASLLEETPFLTVKTGRMEEKEMRRFFMAEEFLAVVDATHPYADVVTKNIRLALCGLSIPYLRLEREASHCDRGQVRYFDSNEACIASLEQTTGNVLLTTGSKELSHYCQSSSLRERLVVRVLPLKQSLALCLQNGLSGKQIIAMQGPFSTEMNEALLRQYHIACLVTKESGPSGGYRQKLEAAEQVGIPVFVVGRPPEHMGLSFAEVCQKLESLLGCALSRGGDLDIVLVGVGMGSPESLTQEAKKAIFSADFLLGAQRMIAPYTPKIEKQPYYLSRDILPYLQKQQSSLLPMERKNAVILFSGDSGFYSGCHKVWEALQQALSDGTLSGTLRILPGISSVSYLAACVGEAYDDSKIYSLHGADLPDLAGKIQQQEKTYLLLSGVEDLHRLGQTLLDHNMADCVVIAGYQLSYPEQELLRLTPKDCLARQARGLYTCLVKNPRPTKKCLTPGVRDELFVRGKVPMTKETVRMVSICKLGLFAGAVVYDIGSGTGSVAVEIARLSDTITVYGVEQKLEGVSLINDNRERFALDNLTVVPGTAPEALVPLPPATHAFLGGSGGQLLSILDTLYEKNPTMRLVLNAISLETISALPSVLSRHPVKDVSVVQLQANPLRELGQYHLPQSENPVWICAFQFAGEGESK
ncbi:MAG: precorrin-6A reductase [Oscillospiraceae bacterium]|nr:precorrin-6A reductase [Oscillospiraceae bacterium]